MTTVLGIDIGGTGIKGAPVDTRSGQLLADRHRILTPHPATPDAVSGVVGELAKFFDWTGPTGATFPAVVKHGVAHTRGERRPGVDRHRRRPRCSRSAIGGEVTVVNDADAAGVAEMAFGAGKGQRGVVIMVTLGTGIGSALFIDGGWCPTPSSVTSRWASTTPSTAPPTACARRRACRGRTGRSASTSTC